MNPIRILIADDHPIVRQGLRILIASEPQMEIVGEATDGQDAILQARACKPDVILMDLVMPIKDGLEAIGEIIKENPAAKILVLTSYSEKSKVFQAIKLGALGYLLKDSPPQQLLDAIRAADRGEPSLHSSIALQVIREMNESSNLPPTENPLTEREVAVLRLVAQGLENDEIATKLVISEWTVRTHIRNILGKLQLANRTQAALYALREGIADLKR